jgi:membrane-bound lytic murein transglycosylase D
LLLLGVVARPVLSGEAMRAASFPKPPEMVADVDFWVQVYSQITTNSGLLHDALKLTVVYERLNDLPPEATQAREDLVNARRQYFHDRLAALAERGAIPADDEDRRILALWHDAATPDSLARAAKRVRFQSGQADRFRQGLERAGAWRAAIEAMLYDAQLPAELAALPYVESTFDPDAYSKAGAAGLWQLMPAAARTHLRIDRAVDERFDPLLSTRAAIAYFQDAHARLGSWPLTVMAYNHGVNGMVRAQSQLGTSDVVRVTQSYASAAFGFASRNFYPSFLAAIEVTQRTDDFFPGLALQPMWKTCLVPVARPSTVRSLEGAFGIDVDRLRILNPALRPGVWQGELPVPAGYSLRLPPQASSPRCHIVRDGDTLLRISRANGISASSLIELNELRSPDRLAVGQLIQLGRSAQCAVCNCAATIAAATTDPSPVFAANHAVDLQPTR